MRDADYGGGSSYGAAFAPDGRLATTSFDGQIRLYPPGLAWPPLRRRAPGGERPFGIAFSADGARLAVGYDDSTRVDVLDGRSLAPLHPAATGGIDNGDLAHGRLGRGRHAAGRRALPGRHGRLPSSPGRRRGAARGGACRRGRTR